MNSILKIRTQLNLPQETEACVVILLFVQENSDHFCLISRDGWALDTASKMACLFSKEWMEVKCRRNTWHKDQDLRFNQKSKDPAAFLLSTPRHSVISL